MTPTGQPSADAYRYNETIRRTSANLRATAAGRAGLVAAGLLLAALAAAGIRPAAAEVWRPVVIGGGGYVDGLVISPSDGSTYARTDVGGAYRWDAANSKWVPLLDWVPYSAKGEYDVDSIAVDPSNGNVVFAALGSGAAPENIFRSTDKGATWTAVGPGSTKIEGNSGTRADGERLAVDPNSSNTVYFGTRYDGVWRSTTGGGAGSWSKLASYTTNGTSGVGVTWVLFDRNSGSPSKTIYAGAYGVGVQVSHDGGATWAGMSGSPTSPKRAAIGGDGALYVTHDNGVARFASNVWTNVTPVAGSFRGVAVDPTNSAKVVVATGVDQFGQSVYRSTNWGASWTKLTNSLTGKAPWLGSDHFSAATAALAFDPANPSRVWLTDWYSAWRTDDIWAALPVVWDRKEEGHEEAVVFGLKSPPSGAPLFSALADIRGFRHLAPFTAFPNAEYVGMTNSDITDIAYQATNPNYMAAVGGKTGPSGAYSTNNGQNWTLFATKPAAGGGGRVAISATSQRIVWTQINDVPRLSTDNGSTWTASTGFPSGALADFWSSPGVPIDADTVNGTAFYGYKAGIFYRSTNSAVSFAQTATLPSETVRFFVRAVPTKAGNVWVGLYTNGLYKSADGGSTFTKLAAVQTVRNFSFGKQGPAASFPSVYVLGTVNNAGDGIYQSDDAGVNWSKISDSSIPIGLIGKVEGDKQTYGTVYWGSAGRGIGYGALQ